MRQIIQWFLLLILGCLVAMVACESENDPEEEVNTIPDEAQVTCPGRNALGDLTAAPLINIRDLQPSDTQVHGRVSNVNAQTAHVVLYAKTDQWYVQPFTATPFTDICSDGSWKNSTHPWTRLVALLVDNTYVPNSTVSARFSELSFM